MLRYLALAVLGGCYMEAGLGGATGGATAHGSIGLIAHFGDVASVHAGAGGAIGPYAPSTGEHGALTASPVTIGGEARFLGSPSDSLVAAFAVDLPISGELHVPNFDESEPANTSRGFVGLGYHHDWWQAPKTGPDDAPRVAGAITTALGADIWYGASRSALRETSTVIGGSFSLTLEVRAWVLGEAFECMGSKHGCGSP